VIGKGLSEGYLTDDELREIVSICIESAALDGKRLLVLIPDTTRTMPMPFVSNLFDELLRRRVRKLDYLVALGTHRPLSDAQLSILVGKQVSVGKIGNTRFINHDWSEPETFTQIGTIPAEEVSLISGGLIAQDVPIRLNKLIHDYDQILICGPVFPHEVVGFSGGNKYFFPGIAGPEVINFTHWLGALITSYKMIGTLQTPVRAVIDRAAEFIHIPTACFSFVVCHEGVAGVYFGSPKASWLEAAKLSAQRHVVYVNKPFKRVLSIMPKMYDDLWTAAKGMYKLEPIIEDNGEVVIYAPHINEVSYTHGKLIDEIGYHCRDYFLSQWEKFCGYPGGVLAHSTHLTGLGKYDPKAGIETRRIKVTLATGISTEHCSRINLGYMAPDEVDVESWKNREKEGILVVPQAGEMLYRINKRKRKL
jgi:nickel-dependent lactate racemase